MEFKISLSNILLLLGVAFFIITIIFQVYNMKKSPSEPEETEEETEE